MIDLKASQLVNEQVGHEFSAFLQYVAISTWLDAEALPELSRYFAQQADEERNHAMKMIQFLNDTNQDVGIPGIPQSQNQFKSVEEAIQLAYDQEVRVTDQIKPEWHSDKQVYRLNEPPKRIPYAAHDRERR